MALARTVVLVALWLGGIAAGYFSALRFESKPGPSARVSAQFPRDTGLALDREQFTLLLFAHPHCPCTGATLDELDRLVAKCEKQLSVRAYFYSDPALGEGWEQSDLWDHARRIHGVAVAADPLGAMASRFGVSTSGDVLLYAPDGALRFEGGITRGRGHAGDNPGSDIIESIVRGLKPAPDRTPTFGCALSACAPDSSRKGSR